MAGQHSGGFLDPTEASLGFSRFNLGALYSTVLNHNIRLLKLEKAMTSANDALTALEQEFSDATDAIAKEIDDLHAQITAGNQSAVDALKPLADRLRDLGTGSSSTPATPASSTSSSDPSNPAPASGV